jgi:tellurite resistance-related uncharacterized protein
MFFKKKNARFGTYPSCDMLNNAIRFIRSGNTESALMEIIYAIEKADGYFYEDIKPVVEEVKRKWWERHQPK